MVINMCVYICARVYIIDIFKCKGLHEYGRAGSAQKGIGLLINREGEKINDGSKTKGSITVFNQQKCK